MKNKSSDQGVKPQIDRFKQAVRELGCDESEAAFDEKIKAVMKKKPQPPTKREDE